MDENANVRPLKDRIDLYVPEGVTEDGMIYWIDYLDQMYGPPINRLGPPLTLSN